MKTKRETTKSNTSSFKLAGTNSRQSIAPIGYGRSSSRSFRDEFFVDPLFGLEVRMENGLVEFERAMEKNEVSELLCPGYYIIANAYWYTGRRSWNGEGAQVRPLRASRGSLPFPSL